jgi:hypothetical protein
MPSQKSWASSITLYNRSFFFFSDVSRLIESMAREGEKKVRSKTTAVDQWPTLSFYSFSKDAPHTTFFLNISILPAAVIV